MSDNHDLLNDNDMCSFSGHEAEDMCFNCGDHTCRVCDTTSKERYLSRLSCLFSDEFGNKQLFCR